MKTYTITPFKWKHTKRGKTQEYTCWTVFGHYKITLSNEYWRWSYHVNGPSGVYFTPSGEGSSLEECKQDCFDHYLSEIGAEEVKKERIKIDS